VRHQWRGNHRWRSEDRRYDTLAPASLPGSMKPNQPLQDHRQRRQR
jgi:hypothetical protein